MSEPIRRGEVWMTSLDPIRGREQAGTRPVLVISEDIYNAGPAGLVLAIPITAKNRGLPHHIRIQPPEAGLVQPSTVLCDGLRSLAKERFLRRMGTAQAATVSQVGAVLSILLGLPWGTASS